MSGWIKLYRNIQSHWLFQEKRTFSKFEAWVDMLMMANHKDNTFLLGNELVETKRGSFITSELKLMNRWNWSKTKVRNFLELLEDEKMIVKVPDTKKTTISIVNYEVYQGEETTEKPVKDQQKTTLKPQGDCERTTKELRKDTNKNDKNDKNDKEVYRDIVECLNEKCNKNFKYTTKKTQTLIDARLKEGFTLEDFKKVIDNKVASWAGTEWEKYLRPNTLFNGDKFEGYLNESGIKQQSKKTRFHNFKQRSDKYSEDQLEAIARKKREEYYEKSKKGE